MSAPTGKVTTAAEAVADIEDGASVGVAGFGLSHRYPSTLIAALAEPPAGDPGQLIRGPDQAANKSRGKS